MNNMVQDRFNDIGAAMTNSGGEIELDLMESRESAATNQAESSQAPFLPPEFVRLDGNTGNSPPWPTVDELEKDEISHVEERGSQQPPRFPVSGPAPGTSKKSAPRPSAPTPSVNPTGRFEKSPRC